MRHDQIMRQIDALEFVQIELVLYLDLHPDDDAARMQWEKNSAELAELERQYKKHTGEEYPLIQTFNGGTRAWVTSPWPWDNQC